MNQILLASNDAVNQAAGKVIESAGHGVASHGSVPFSTTLIFSGILVAMIATLALEEKIHAKKSVIVGFYAVVSLLLGSAMHILPFGAMVNVFGEKMQMPVYIPAVDWGGIAIILGSSLFVDITSKALRQNKLPNFQLCG